MLVIAIDPGPEKSGYVLVDDKTYKIYTSGEEKNEYLLDFIVHEGQVQPAYLVIEKIASFGMSVGESVFQTVYWTGRFAEAWRRETNNLPEVRIRRKEIVVNICGTSKAKDANIRQALIDRLGPQGTKSNPGPTYGIGGHRWSALAVAVTFIDMNK